MANHQRMMTDARQLIYDFDRRAGWLHQGPATCCDMMGTIAVFEAIDPAVEAIFTFVNGVSDTRYLREPGGWVAYGYVQS